MIPCRDAILYEKAPAGPCHDPRTFAGRGADSKLFAWHQKRSASGLQSIPGSGFFQGTGILSVRAPLPPPFSTDVSVSRASLGETVGGKSAATRGPPGWGRRHLLRPMNGVQCWGAVVSNTVFSCAGDPPALTPLLCHCGREEEPHPDSQPRWALGAQGAQIHPTPGQPAQWTSRQPALRREPSLTREPRGTHLIAAPHLLPSRGP